MERVAVESKMLAAVGYDATASVLEIEFRSGRLYRFEGVPASVHAWLMRTPAKGAYFARMIRDQYPFRDVTPGEPSDLAQELQRSLDRLGAPE